jgi:acetyltransferase
VASLQLELASRPNGLHRAEMMKVMVHSRHRRQGIAALMLKHAEVLATTLGRSTLVLDTQHGSAAEALYIAQGWSICGQIPNYALGSDGSFHATTVMYKILK